MDDFEVDGANRYTSGDDPNKDVLQSASESIKPQFQLGDNNSASSPNRILGNAEKEASASINNNTDSDDTKSDASTAESMGGNGFANNVSGSGTKTSITAGGLKSFFKKRAPLFVLITLLGGGGIGIMSTQNLLPFALATRAMQEWNSQEIMSSRRYRVLLNKKLRVETGKKATNMFGDFKISKKQKRFLKKQGIDVVTIEAGGKKAKALLADDGTGKKKLILGNGKSSADKSFRNAVNADIASGKLKVKGAKNVDFGSNKKAVTFKTALKTDNDFFIKFNYGSKPIASHVSGWFDNVFEGFRKRLKLTRNRWFGFKRSDGEEVRTKNFKDRGKLDEGKLRIENKAVGEEEDDDGNKTTVESDTETRASGSDADIRQQTLKNIKTKAEVAGKAASKAGGICMLYAMMGAINAIKYAAEMAQVLNYTSGFYEAVDKTKAGEGDASAMAEYLNDLGRPDKNGLTGLSATGIGALISGTHVNTAKAYDKSADPKEKAQAESALKYNFDDSVTIGEAVKDPSMLKDFFGGIKYTVRAMQNCVYARIFAASAGLISDTIDVVLLVTTFGIGTAVKKLGTAALKVAASAAMQVGLSFLAGIFIPKVAEMLIDNLVDGVLGPDLGNALASGSNMYLGKNHQAGGGSPGKEAEVMAFKREQAAVLAENARVDRAMLSPFDTSTNNTFLGKLAFSVMPLTTTISSISLTTNKLSNLVSSSVANLLPSASAIGETRLTQEQGVCPTLNSIDIVADGFCNPYYISDTTTFGDYDNEEDPFDPELLFAFVADADPDNFQKNSAGEIEVNEDGNPIINNDLKNSELFQYINFCSNRDSMFGTADQNIANSFRLIDSDSTVSTVLDAVPFVGDIKDIAESIEDGSNYEWIGGRNCVADNSNPDWTKKMRLYQRYIEDQRLYENMGAIEKSTVQIALDDYHEEHPIDTSETAVIARFSGLTKNQVEDTLAIVDYYNYLAEYDPSELYPGYEPSPVTTMIGSLYAKNTSPKAPVSTLYESPLFIDLRNRNFSI